MKKKIKDKYILILIIGIFIIMYLFSVNRIYLFKLFNSIGNDIKNILIPKIDVSDINNEIVNGINKEIEEELKELSDTLNLEINDYKFITANVISRDINWYQEITINKGKKDGIKENMAVVSNLGLIGKTAIVYDNTTVVSLISKNDNSKIAVDIKNDNNTYHGILEEYLGNNVLKINNINKNNEIELGNKVYTNGLGGIYPSGIYIGEVIEIETDQLGLSKVVKVKATSNFDKLRYVTVIDR